MFEIWLSFRDSAPPIGPGFLIIEASRSLSGTQYSVGLLRTVIRPTQSPLPAYTTLAVFEHTISASERPQIHALGRAATVMG